MLGHERLHTSVPVGPRRLDGVAHDDTASALVADLGRAHAADGGDAIEGGRDQRGRRVAVQQVPQRRQGRVLGQSHDGRRGHGHTVTGGHGPGMSAG